ncbi:MAG: M48 family metallopeptidase [bacterium]|nr:M48 family metallopeptidase [bacterium]
MKTTLNKIFSFFKGKEASATEGTGNKYLDLCFERERELLKQLEDDFELKNYYDVFDDPKDVREMHSYYLGTALKVNEVLAPRLYKLFKEVSDVLDFHEAIEFYILASPEVNAWSINGFGHGPHIIVLTSALIQLLKDNEIRFVIGHEVGHLIFDHSKPLQVYLMLSRNQDEDSRNVMLENKVAQWQRYSEISSDRMGYLACRDIEIIGRSFFKFASGLSEEHLNFDIIEFMKQLKELKKMKRGKMNLLSTHPLSLIRLKALQLFKRSELLHTNFHTKLIPSKLIPPKELAQEIIELMELMELHPDEEKGIKTIEFIASTGLLLSHSGEKLKGNIYSSMVEGLLNYTTEPEKYLKFESHEKVEKQQESACKYLVKSSSSLKYDLFKFSIYLALAEGRLDEVTKNIIVATGKNLKINEDEINHFVREVSEEHLNLKSKSPEMSFGGNR